jgi:hypothetical protein
LSYDVHRIDNNKEVDEIVSPQRAGEVVENGRDRIGVRTSPIQDCDNRIPFAVTGYVLAVLKEDRRVAIANNLDLVPLGLIEILDHIGPGRI